MLLLQIIMELEEWKDIDGFLGIYKISSFGRIKTLSRLVKCKNNKTRLINERILNPAIDGHGYYQVSLCFKGSSKKSKMHILAAVAFLGHVPRNFELIVDHKDNNKLNNHKDNLQITTMRHNSSKDQFRHNRTSRYTGVSWDKQRKKWASCITIKGKTNRLGYFFNEIEASESYQIFLSKM